MEAAALDDPGRSQRVHLSLYIALLAGHVALLWTLPHVPTADGPSHAYNVSLLRELRAGRPELTRIHEESGLLSPNLGYHLVAWPLAAALHPLVVERIFLTLTLVLLVAALPFYLKALGREAFPLSHAAMLIPFNHSFLMGFHSYLLSVPVVLLGLGLAWRCRSAPFLARSALANVAAVAAFLLHAVGYAILLAALALLELLEGRGRSPLRRLGTFLISLLPSLLLGAGWSLLKGGGSLAWARSGVSYIVDLACFSMLNLSWWQAPFCLAALALLLAAIAPGLRDLRRGAPIPAGERFGLTAAGLIVLIYLVTPGEFLGGGYFPQRLPWVAFLLAIPAFRLPAAPGLRRLFVATLVLLPALGLAMNGALLKRESDRVDRFAQGLSAELPPGATVMTARFDWPSLPCFPRYDPLANAASHYGLRGAVCLGNYEALQPYFPLRFKPGLPSWPPYPEVYRNAAAIPWERHPWPEFLLCWELTAEAESALQRHFELHWRKEGSPLSIWRRKP